MVEKLLTYMQTALCIWGISKLTVGFNNCLETWNKFSGKHVASKIHMF